jgi:trans-2,3-dihydro-3-hydroxyanthranilate isomerase
VARRYSELGERFSLHLYAGGSSDLKARMFAPLAGTMEDPATGSANAALTGLLLTLSGRTTAEFTIYQGQEMGRPSVLHSFAHREGESVRAGVSGRCMPVLSGIARVRSEQNEA